MLMQRLTPLRREIIRPVLEQPSSYVLLSLRAVSRKRKSEPTTLLRTVQAMGFKRYRDFQHYLHERSIAFSTSLDFLEKSLKRGTGLEGLIRSSVERDLDNLKQLRNHLDPARVIALAKRLYGSRRILIISGDMDASLALYLNYNLAMLGLNVGCAISAGEITHRVRHLKRSDVAIAISFGKGLRQVVEGFKDAHETGAYCAGVSDTVLSPLARYANQFFLTPTDRISFADSYVAGMAFLNVILVACANVHRRRTVALLKRAAQEQRIGYRWYSEEA